MEEDQRGGDEVTTFLDDKDHRDPLNVQQNKLSILAINSPKDMELSDKDATDYNDNKAKAISAELLE